MSAQRVIMLLQHKTEGKAQIMFQTWRTEASDSERVEQRTMRTFAKVIYGVLGGAFKHWYDIALFEAEAQRKKRHAALKMIHSLEASAFAQWLDTTGRSMRTQKLLRRACWCACPSEFTCDQLSGLGAQCRL